MLLISRYYLKDAAWGELFMRYGTSQQQLAETAGRRCLHAVRVSSVLGMASFKAKLKLNAVRFQSGTSITIKGGQKLSEWSR